MHSIHHCICSAAARRVPQVANPLQVLQNLHIECEHSHEDRARWCRLCLLLHPQSTMFQLYQSGLFLEHSVGGMGPLIQPAWSKVVSRGWEDATKEVSVSGIQRSVAHAISSLQARPLSQVRV